MSSYSLALRSALADVVQSLVGFAIDPLFAENFSLVFGTKATAQEFEVLTAVLPDREVLPDEVLQGAIGAFSAQTRKIYLSESVVNGDSRQLQAVLLEEIGHYLDSAVNGKDTPGEEGAIFAALIMGESLSGAELTQLRAEDDHGAIIVDGAVLAVEMANFTGTAVNDTITGTAGADVIDGLAGNDTLSGLGGNDILNGGDGNDTLNGGAGNDTLNGDSGTNILDGGGGDDVLIPATGTSVDDESIVNGGTGNDLLIANFTNSNTRGLNFSGGLGIYNHGEGFNNRYYNDRILEDV
ncbi:MAG: hypothetical protein ACK58N_17780 [Synechocystis sp.]